MIFKTLQYAMPLMLVTARCDLANRILRRRLQTGTAQTGTNVSTSVEQQGGDTTASPDPDSTYLDLVRLVKENKGITFDDVADALALERGFTDDARRTLVERVNSGEGINTNGMEFAHGYTVSTMGDPTEVYFITNEGELPEILADWTRFNLNGSQADTGSTGTGQAPESMKSDEDAGSTGTSAGEAQKSMEFGEDGEGWDLLKEIMTDPDDILALFKIETKSGFLEVLKRVVKARSGEDIKTDTLREDFSLTADQLATRDNGMYPDTEQAKDAAAAVKQSTKKVAEEPSYEWSGISVSEYYGVETGDDDPPFVALGVPWDHWLLLSLMAVFTV